MTGYVCPPDHKHAETLTCRTSHLCSCDDCKAHHRDYQFWRRHMIASGRTDAFDSLLPATGTRRRIEALMAIGWSQNALAAHLDTPQASISEWLRRRYVRTSTALLVADIYEPLSVTRPPTDTPSQRMSVHRTIALAKRRGYAGPFDWDDIDTDLAPADPSDVEILVDEVAIDLALTGNRVQLTTAERHVAVRTLHRRGYNDQEMAGMLHVVDRTILRDRQALDLAPNLGNATERFAA